MSLKNQGKTIGDEALALYPPTVLGHRIYTPFVSAAALGALESRVSVMPL